MSTGPWCQDVVAPPQTLKVPSLAKVSFFSVSRPSRPRLSAGALRAGAAKSTDPSSARAIMMTLRMRSTEIRSYAEDCAVFGVPLIPLFPEQTRCRIRRNSASVAQKPGPSNLRSRYTDRLSNMGNLATRERVSHQTESHGCHSSPSIRSFGVPDPRSSDSAPDHYVQTTNVLRILAGRI